MCAFSCSEKSELVLHCESDHPLPELSSGAHPCQPHTTSHATLQDHNTLLISFGRGESSPQALWCNEPSCSSVIVGAEINKHWLSRGGAKRPNRHPEESRPHKTKRDVIIETFPHLIQTSDELRALTLGPAGPAGVFPQELRGLPSYDKGYVCGAPLCGHCVVDEKAFKNHAQWHVERSSPMPKPRETGKIQRLGGRRDWPLFQVTPLTSQSDLLKRVHSDFLLVVPPTKRIQPLNNITNSLPLHVTLGWAGIVDSFHGDTQAIQTLRSTTYLQNSDGLGALHQFVGNYVGQVALECLESEDTRLAWAVAGDQRYT